MRLTYAGYLLMENRHGLVVDTRLTHGERTRWGTNKELRYRPVAAARAMRVTAHIAQNIIA
jgi:hypothetical protein